VVNVAHGGETFTTLDQKERRLDPEMLMICDGEKPVAIGGVMGGLNSEVEDTTTRVLLESAYFDPVCIRKTAKKLGLSTDASHRFERGVDPRGTTTALHRVAQLIVEISGGKLISGAIDEHPKPLPDKIIDCSVNALNRHLGTRLDQNEIESFLRSIEFDVEKIDNDKLRVFPPSCRVDISRFEDLTEEIARLLGYDNIQTTFPLIPADARKTSGRVDSRIRIKNLMTGVGFTEAINYSFINKLSCDRLQIRPDDPKRKQVEILNRLSEDQSVLRTSLVPGLLETMHRNLAMQNKNLKFFEMGNVFFSTGEIDSQPTEVEMLAGLWTGIRNDALWFSEEINCDFYDLKGVVEELLKSLGVVNVTFTGIPPEFCCYTKPGYTAEVFITDEPLGLLGELHPNVLRNYDLKQTAFIFELNFDRLLDQITTMKSAQPIPKFPATSRDITLVVDKNVEALKILKCVETLDEDLVESLHLFDVFEGDSIPSDKKSISFRITYRSLQETLADDKVNRIHKNIADSLLKEFDAALPA
jgi:phenylalanyl-tRNA synthetase beta chain